MNHPSRIGPIPKCPMSAYSASAPVTTRTMDPSNRNVPDGFAAISSMAYSGFTAASTLGSETMARSPRNPNTPNHKSITGPKMRPMCPVPNRCTANRNTRTTVVSGATHPCKLSSKMVRPSIADSTEMDGVMTPSPNSNALPMMAMAPKNANR